MTNKDWQAVNWNAHATIEDGSDRIVWAYYDDEDKKVFQITEGKPPETSGGYHRLESLLDLKGISMGELRTVGVLSP